jgi:DeoR family fructose operon transcriptional repressor
VVVAVWLLGLAAGVDDVDLAGDLVAATTSRKTVLLADATKFGVDSTYRFAGLRDVSTVLTERSVKASLLRRIRAAGVEVVTV